MLNQNQNRLTSHLEKRKTKQEKRQQLSMKTVSTKSVIPQYTCLTDLKKVLWLFKTLNLVLISCFSRCIIIRFFSTLKRDISMKWLNEMHTNCEQSIAESLMIQGWMLFQETFLTPWICLRLSCALFTLCFTGSYINIFPWL